MSKAAIALTENGVILRRVIPAGQKLSGKERGEWVKLTAEEVQLIRQLRAARRDA